jgi:hypothetical protein
MDASASSPSRSTQLKTIVALFIVLRLTILFLYTPQGLLNAYTDFSYYYRTAQLSDRGYYPFVNMWYEYPPVLPYTTEAVYRVAQSIVPLGGLDSFGYQFFARLLGSLMLVFETGVLILIHRIASRAWGVSKADWLSWVYSTLSLPLFFWNASQTSNVTFFLLLAIDWLIVGRQSRSALALGLGIATKLIPVFLLGAVFRFLWPRLQKLIRYSLIAGLVAAATYLPFLFLGGGRWIAASLASTFSRASWATPWAMIDGNWSVGDVGDLSTRTQLNLSTVLHGNPPVIPSIVVLVVFAIIYLWLFRRPIEQPGPRQFIWLSTLMAMLFYLWSKGWSPQWATLIIPLLLLSFPDRRGLGLTLLLTGLVFLEWPISDALHSQLLLSIAIVGRTALFTLAAYWTFKRLWPSSTVGEPAA